MSTEDGLTVYDSRDEVADSGDQAYCLAYQKFYPKLVVALNVDKLIPLLGAFLDDSGNLRIDLEAKPTLRERNKLFLDSMKEEIKAGKSRRFKKLVDLIDGYANKKEHAVLARIVELITRYVKGRIQSQQVFCKKDTPLPNLKELFAMQQKQLIAAAYSNLSSPLANPSPGPSLTGKIRRDAPPLVPSLLATDHKIQWTQAASLPVPMYSAAAAVNKNKVYIAGPSSPEDNSKYSVFAYDIAKDEWEKLPEPKHFLAVQEIVDGQLTLFGGRERSNNLCSRLVSTYCESSHSWESIYPNLLTARNRCAVVTHGDYVIVAGGNAPEGCVKSIEVMNITDRVWRRSAANLPVAMWNMSTTVCNNSMFIVGYAGGDNQRYIAAYRIDVEHLEATIGGATEWKEIAKPLRGRTTIIPNCYPPVVVGGNTGDFSGVADISVYNADGNSWKVIDSLRTPRAYAIVAAVGDNAVMVMGGCKRARNLETCKASAVTTVEIGQAVPV